MQKITILGSTGSIGVQALDVISRHPDLFRVEALIAHRNVELLFSQCQQFSPRFAVLVDTNAAAMLREKVRATKLNIEVLAGEQAMTEVAADSGSDTVLAAIVGAAGLVPTLAAVQQGKRILLANKEAVVMAGDLFAAAVRKHQATVLPVDSEHNAIFQCMPSDFIPMRSMAAIDSIILTASGGPFRTLPLNEFANITPQQAVAHPNWSMGKKISVDSATMMNKGLEVIEAHYFFGLELAKIEVLLHPQGIVHSMVRYADGSVLAQLGHHDMRTPIAHTLSWPRRIASGVPPLNFAQIARLEFAEIEAARYSCLALAYAALRQGGTAITALNAANEVAVEAFLQGRIRFSHIAQLIEQALNEHDVVALDSLETALLVDRKTRDFTAGVLEKAEV